MPSTDELLTQFVLLLNKGFSVPNARRAVEREVTGRRQLERLREALDRLEKEGRDGEVS